MIIENSKRRKRREKLIAGLTNAVGVRVDFHGCSFDLGFEALLAIAYMYGDCELAF